jgi:hypothetical protein
MMASLRHPNIVAFMGVCTNPPAIITEYCERGSLTGLLQAAKALPERAAEMTWRFRIRMVRACMLACVCACIGGGGGVLLLQ